MNNDKQGPQVVPLGEFRDGKPEIKWSPFLVLDAVVDQNTGPYRIMLHKANVVRLEEFGTGCKVSYAGASGDISRDYTVKQSFDEVLALLSP